MWIRTRITEAARQRGWTAAQIARQLGLYRSNLSAMDAGRRSVSLQALHRIAEWLGVSASDLIETVPKMEPRGRSPRYLENPPPSFGLWRGPSNAESPGDISPEQETLTHSSPAIGRGLLRRRINHAASAYTSWLQGRIQEKESKVPDGTKRDWVHQSLLTWQRHYRKARRSS